MKISKQVFGELDGQKVISFLMENDHGMEVTCLNYGCTITSIQVPDKEGSIENVVLGFDSLHEYISHSPFFGCIVGRVAGRVTNSTFELEGSTYHLPKNEGDNHLHGGNQGFDKVIWEAEIGESVDECKVIFSHLSRDGDAGYPGNVKVSVTYTLNNNNELLISYHATTDKRTIINLTNHSYFNLSGDVKRDILTHELTIKSDSFLELSDSLLPTGKLLQVEGTAFDFRGGRLLKDGVESDHQQNTLVGGGYDHPLVLTENRQEEICLIDHESGRQLIVETDEPAVVLYTSNMMTSDFEIRGVPARKHLGVCLETQHHPDAIHHPTFPSIVLDKDQEYKTMTKYRFSVK
ncbi:galactose mutarotase [Alkalihalobacillus sp. MEB130]|uniref:aldose epimerase family protein n=1 Tax=Alkalihalobacillus sp. MEB130 TaxID=2976704 RepID=UPI0028DE8A29|nr:aldose epimerase family protein [Alkalihalobacillus sp. MEB130]MDT8862779.1 galactose mutarotase [Alkalihalobacillus sp. MEB130]